MSRVNWIPLLEANGIEYVTSGKNVVRGEINLQCPFCGPDDPSHHLGINLETGFWSCWRNRAEHRGKRPHRLLMRLLGLSYAVVERMVREAPTLPDGFESFCQELSQSAPEGVSPVAAMPDDFLLIQAGDPHCADHLAYLRQRGISATFAHGSGLRYCATSLDTNWFQRVIIPYTEDGQVMAWTGRSIVPSSVRYLSSSPTIHPGTLPTSDLVYNVDSVEEGALVICEGPFDAMNVQRCGMDEGISAVALSTTSVSERQLAILVSLMDDFDFVKIIVALDRGASRQADLIVKELAPFGNVGRYDLPEQYGDPGELPRKEVLRMMQ